MLAFNYCPLSHNLAPSPQVDAPAKSVCWPIRVLKSRLHSDCPIKRLKFCLEVSRSRLLPWRLLCCHGSNGVYFYFVSNKPNHGPIGEERTRRESSKNPADDIRMKRWVLLFSTGPRARWSRLTLALNFSSVLSMWHKLLNQAQSLASQDAYTVLLLWEEHGCCGAEVFYCQSYFYMMTEAN